jgi:hypothetical protein
MSYIIRGLKFTKVILNLLQNKLILSFQGDSLIMLILKIAVFWVVAPCSLVEIYQRFRGPCCLHHQGDRPDQDHRPDVGGSKDL